jgi:hypothetical protein
MGCRYPLSVQFIRQCPMRHEALRLQLTNGRNQSACPGVCGPLGRCSTANPSPAGRSFPVSLHRAIMAAHLAAALFQSEHRRPHKAPRVLLPRRKGSKLMERSKTGNRSAFAQAITRRDDAMRDMLGMGSDPVGHAEVDAPFKPQVGIWRIAGNWDRSRAGWANTAAARTQRREGRPPRRTPTAVSGVWLFLLSSLAGRNGLLSLRFSGAHRKKPNG